LNSYSVFEEDGTTPAIGTDYNDITRLDVFFDGAKLSIIASGVSDAIDVELTPFDDISSTNVQDGMEEINTKFNNLGITKETIAVPVGISGPVWTKQTEMDVLPDTEGWTDIIAGGTIDLSGGILNILTIGTDTAAYDIEAGNIVAADIKRMQGRVRVNASGGNAEKPGHWFRIDDGAKRVGLFLETDKITLFNNTSSPTVLHTIDMTVFRVVRIEVDNVSGLKLYVDDLVTPVSTTPYASLFTTAGNVIEFADSDATNNDQNGDVDYDYIYYQLDLANNPDIVGDWEEDGTFPELFSASITTVNPVRTNDDGTVKYKPIDSVSGDWVSNKSVREDRVDDNTYKLYALDGNDVVFDLEFVVTKDKA
jgi:hypothetical protein